VGGTSIPKDIDAFNTTSSEAPSRAFITLISKIPSKTGTRSLLRMSIAKFDMVGIGYNLKMNTLHPLEITKDAQFTFSLAGKIIWNYALTQIIELRANKYADNISFLNLKLMTDMLHLDPLTWTLLPEYV